MDRVATYSQGMCQRLGIARALLTEPRLLMLDEPTNGLDPQGMRDVRELIRRLAASGVTILLSSHLLGEVEAVATRWYGVPITSYYWYLMYGAMLYIFTHALYPKLKTRSLGSRLACAPLVSIAVCVAGALAFELMFWLPRGLGVSEHVIVATWFAVVLALAAMVRAPAARPPERWLVINVVLFHAFHLLVMVWLWSAGRLTNTTGKLLLITAAVAVALTILKGLPLRGHVRSTR
jgi:hypothetical protein